MEYRVKWQMSFFADSPKEAAEKALKVQRNPNSIATYFTVESHQAIYNVDLLHDEIVKKVEKSDCKHEWLEEDDMTLACAKCGSLKLF